MLKGYDTSHHQNDETFNKYLEQADFMIIKATEGKTYTDPCFKKRAKILNDMEIFNGFYHYARPDNNTPSQEADNFYNTIREYVNNFTIIVLDWEGKSLQYSFDWATEFCKIMQEKLKRPCIIYASASIVRMYAYKWRYWWTAHYNSQCQSGCNHDGVEEIMVQFTSTPIDIDTFKGSKTDWMKLCGTEFQPIVTEIFSWKENGKTYRIIKEG